jgi:hypothetical protein
MRSLSSALVLIGALLLQACSREEPRSPAYYESKFIKIEKTILEDAFKPGEIRSLSVPSTQARWIRLVTDQGYDLSMKNRSDGKANIRLFSEDHPDEYVETTYGAATIFHPENGLIRLKVSNRSDFHLRIAVCIIRE